MIRCLKCNNENIDDANYCDNCGHLLVADTKIFKEKQETECSMVWSTPDVLEANTIKEILEANKIKVYPSDENISRLNPLGTYTITVDKHHKNQAEEIIRATLENQGEILVKSEVDQPSRNNISKTTKKNDISMANSATFIQRLSANFIDNFIIIFLLLLAKPALTMIKETKISFSLLILTLIILLSYKIFFHWKYGKSIGKMVMQIKVIKTNGFKIDFRAAFLRSSIDLALPLFIIFIALLIGILKVSYKIEFDPMVFKVFKKGKFAIFYLWSVLDIGYYFFNNKRQTLHDVMADTSVVEA